MFEHQLAAKENRARKVFSDAIAQLLQFRDEIDSKFKSVLAIPTEAGCEIDETLEIFFFLAPGPGILEVGNFYAEG